MYDHGESIYNIIPPKPVQQEKPPMHKSKHSGAIPPTASTFHQPGTTHPATSNLSGAMDAKPVQDKGARTMGAVPGAVKNDPSKFMTAGERSERVATLSEVKRTQPDVLKPTQLKTKSKPTVPKAEATPVMNLVTSKNFIVANAVETILAAPKKVQDGAKDYLRKEDYGNTPAYLKHIKKDIQAEYDYIRQLQQQHDDMNRAPVQPLDESEREVLIEGLKAKWEAINTEYQGTTHITKLDTFGKIKRKEKYEAELSLIEKDIERLNRKNILVNASS
jgi:hypothetical protein